MAKYTEEIKQKAVKAAKEGKSLKEIQTTIGPNPKATMRYLAKEGLEYKDLKAKLIKEGKLKPNVNTQEVSKNTKDPLKVIPKKTNPQ